MRRLFLAIALLLAGCAGQTGTDTGNPIVGIQVLGRQDSAAAKAMTSFQTSGITVTEARIVLNEINLEPLMGCLIEEGPGPEPPELEFEFTGPFVIDLLDNISVPDLGTVVVPPDTYCELELKFDKLEPESVPAGISPSELIVGNALVIQGTRQDGTPFIARLTEDDRFKLEGTHPEGFEILGGLSIFFVTFSLDTWFNGVDLDAAIISESGVIFLDSENNLALWTTLIDNVKHSARLFRDLDGDGILDPNEDEASLVLGEGVDDDE